MKTLEEKIHDSIAMHEEIFLKQREAEDGEGEYLTTAIILTEGKGIIACLPQWAEHRDLLGAKLHDEAVKEKALCIVFGADGWWLEPDDLGIDTTDMAPEDMPRPRDYPLQRKEALVISTIWPDGSCQMVFKPYEMHDGKVVWYEPKHPMHGEGVKTQQYMVKPWGPQGSQLTQ